MSDGQTELCKAVAEQNKVPISPLPWRLGNCGSIVCDDPKRDGILDEARSREFYGGDVVCESLQRSDAEFILRMANAQDVLPPDSLGGFDALGRFVVLDHERRQVEERLDAIKKEQMALQERVLDEWVERGQQSAKVDGLTVYVAHEFYCSKRGEISTEQLIEILKSAGLDRCVQVGYNASSLKAFVKESLASDSELPEALKQCLNYDTTPRLRTRLS